MRVIKSWTPINAVETDEECKIEILNREYILNEESPFFSSIKTLNEELLSSPMRIIVENKGVPCDFCKTKSFMMTTSTDERVNIVSTAESEYVIVNVSHGIEFDGCDEITLSVMPTGRSVAACFGLEPFETDGFDLNKLYLEIPLKKEFIKYFTVYPSANVEFYNNPDEADEFGRDAAFKSSGKIPPSGLHFPFITQLYVNGEDRGFGIFFESDEFFENIDKGRVFEVLDNGEEIVIRIRFFDKTPSYWLDKGENNEMSRELLPIKFHFGMQVTPVKKMESRPYKEKSFHVDAFIKIPRKMHYDEFFSKAVVDGDDEIGFDRI